MKWTACGTKIVEGFDQIDRWEIGRHYYDRSTAGILFRHPEISGAEFLSVFDPVALVAKGVQATHYRFRWDGSRIPLIYDFDTCPYRKPKVADVTVRIG